MSGLASSSDIHRVTDHGKGEAVLAADIGALLVELAHIGDGRHRLGHARGADDIDKQHAHGLTPHRRRQNDASKLCSSRISLSRMTW